MKKNPLFPQLSGIMHGGDYNPEQWLDRPDILEEDIRLMKKAGMTSATLGVFSWSVYEPREDEFHFEWLKDIMDRLYENGIYTILATPSGARPAWLDEKYPEALRVDSYGMRAHHGMRHNHCMSSPAYRNRVRIVTEQLIRHVGSHPGLLMWHISNEFGGECYCPLCAKRFQEYLADKFHHDISTLNHAWWTTFWSHAYQDFSQIEPPFQNGEGSIMGLNLEWKRFTTFNMTDYMKSEISLLREKTPSIPITTNFMTLYGGLDYHVMAKELDVISWDSYAPFHNDYETLWDTFAANAFSHAHMRSMKKGTPFMLMESAPGLVNWQPYNKLRRPGIHALESLQAVACGSDTVQYFQWRKGRGSAEQYHGAVVDHLGTDDTRIFREVSSLGADLAKLTGVSGTIVPSRVAILYDWDIRWAIEDMRGLAPDTKRYVETCISFYKEFLKLGIDPDIISCDHALDDYDIVLAPMLYLIRDGLAERLTAFVENGGQLLATYLTGYVDENTLCFLGGFPGNGLSRVFGIVSEEIDTLFPSDRNVVLFSDNRKGTVCDYAEVLRVSTAEVLGIYTEDYYRGTAAVTKNRFGKGAAYYVAARLDMDSLKPLFLEMLKKAGISTLSLPEGVEHHCRTGDGEAYHFYLNTTEQTQTVSGVSGTNLLNGEAVNGSLLLQKYETAIVQV